MTLVVREVTRLLITRPRSGLATPGDCTRRRRQGPALGGEGGEELDQVSEDGLQESDTVLLMLKPSTDSRDVTLGLMELRWNPDTLTCIMPLSNFGSKLLRIAG